jgi:2-amino-4-hydroxy-6-hydroxymethyldihydropteridine diphosphokinase
VRRAFVSLGSNVGDRAAHLRAGVDAVAGSDEHRVSSVYLTEPWGPVRQDDYYNVVVELMTDASPRELLERCRRAEAAEGRTRDVRFGPRTLDADVLLVGDEVVDEDDLQVPHPRMAERRFVLVPLAELAPEIVTTGQMAGATGAVERVGTLSALG